MIACNFIFMDEGNGHFTPPIAVTIFQEIWENFKLKLGQLPLREVNQTMAAAIKSSTISSFGLSLADVLNVSTQNFQCNVFLNVKKKNSVRR